MDPWRCGIASCGQVFDTLEATIRHQAREHSPHECKVCGDLVPAGFFAIRHAVTEHRRTEYARAYDLTASDIKQRESLVERIETDVDVLELQEQFTEDERVSDLVTLPG